MKSLYERLLDDEDNLVAGMDEGLIESLIYKIYESKYIKKKNNS